LTYNDMFSII